MTVQPIIVHAREDVHKNDPNGLKSWTPGAFWSPARSLRAFGVNGSQFASPLSFGRPTCWGSGSRQMSSAVDSFRWMSEEGHCWSPGPEAARAERGKKPGGSRLPYTRSYFIFTNAQLFHPVRSILQFMAAAGSARLMISRCDWRKRRRGCDHAGVRIAGSPAPRWMMPLEASERT